MKLSSCANRTLCCRATASYCCLYIIAFVYMYVSQHCPCRLQGETHWLPSLVIVWASAALGLDSWSRMNAENYEMPHPHPLPQCFPTALSSLRWLLVILDYRLGCSLCSLSPPQVSRDQPYRKRLSVGESRPKPQSGYCLAMLHPH